MHPWKLFGWTIAAMFVAFFAQDFISLRIQNLPIPYLLSVFLPSAAGLAVAVTFYLVVRGSQKKHGPTEPASWKIDAAFWVGLLFFAVLCVLEYLSYLHFYSALKPGTSTNVVLSISSSLRDVIPNIVNSLMLLLFICLVYPVLEKRHGAVRGALLFAAGFALLTLLERLMLSAANRIELSFLYLFLSIFMSCLASVVQAVPLIALYQIASRRMPGTWLLFSSVFGLLALSENAIASLVDVNGGMVSSTYIIMSTCIKISLDLLVFAVSLGLLCSFQHWKTFGAFWADAKVLVRRTQGDVEE